MTQQEQSIGAVTWRRIIAILRFPALLAIVLPLALLVTFHQGTSHKLRLAAVADDSRVRLLADEPHRGYPRGFAVLGWRTPAAAAAGVRAGEIAGAHIAGSADTIHVARADYAIDARYVQGVFTRFAAATGGRAPRDVDFESQASGDGGIGIFFLVFPVMMAGAITTIVLLRRPTWGVGRRVALVAGVRAVSAVGAYSPPSACSSCLASRCCSRTRSCSPSSSARRTSLERIARLCADRRQRADEPR